MVPPRTKKPRQRHKRLKILDFDEHAPFDYDSFIAEENLKAGGERYSKAPEHAFWQNPIVPTNQFFGGVGKKIAIARWRLYPSTRFNDGHKTWLLATIIDNLHICVGVRLDGTENKMDYWVLCDDCDIAPARRILEESRYEAPLRASLTEEAQDYQKFVEISLQFEDGEEDPSAPEEWFKPLPVSIKPKTNPFKLGMIFEAIDVRDSDGYIRPVKVSKVEEDFITVTFIRTGLGIKDWREKYDCRFFFPAGWAAKANAKFCPPRPPKKPRAPRKITTGSKTFLCTVCETFESANREEVDEHDERIHGGDYVPDDAKRCVNCGAPFLEEIWLGEHVELCLKNPDRKKRKKSIATVDFSDVEFIDLSESPLKTTIVTEITSSPVELEPPAIDQPSTSSAAAQKSVNKRIRLNLAIKRSNPRPKMEVIEEEEPIGQPTVDWEMAPNTKRPKIEIESPAQNPASSEAPQAPAFSQNTLPTATSSTALQDSPEKLTTQDIDRIRDTHGKLLSTHTASTSDLNKQIKVENTVKREASSSLSTPAPEDPVESSQEVENSASTSTKISTLPQWSPLAPGPPPDSLSLASGSNSNLAAATSGRSLVENATVQEENEGLVRIVTTRSFLTKNVYWPKNDTVYEYPHADSAAPALQLDDPEKRSNEDIDAIQKKVIDPLDEILAYLAHQPNPFKNQILLVDTLFKGLNEHALENCNLVRAEFPFMPSWLLNILSTKRRLLRLINQKITTIYYFLGYDILTMYRTETTQYKINRVTRAISEFIPLITPDEDGMDENDEIFDMKNLVLITVPAIGLLQDTIQIYNAEIRQEVVRLKKKHANINIELVDWAKMSEGRIAGGAPFSMDDRLKMLMSELKRFGLKYKNY